MRREPSHRHRDGRRYDFHERFVGFDARHEAMRQAKNLRARGTFVLLVKRHGGLQYDLFQLGEG